MRIPVAVFAVLAVSPWLSVPRAQDRQVGSLSWAPTTFETREGPKKSVAAESGTLIVETNWAAPNGHTLGLNLVRFRAMTDSPGAPIVYLAGGPGGSGILSAAGDRFPLFMQLRESADVIALDQRGVRSDPFPSCPGALQLPLDQPPSAAAWLPILRLAARACVEKWRAAGIDLATLDAVNSAHDLEALRRALNVPRLNLLGISYGTHLGLTAVRLHPDLAARVVFAGVEGPDDTLKLPSAAEAHLRTIAALADADPGRHDEPPLLQLFAAAAERLRTPAAVNARIDKRDVTVTIGVEDLRMAALELTSERRGIEQFPRRLARIASGDFTELGAWAVSRRSLPGLLPMAYVNDCASGATASRLEQIAREAPGSLLGRSFNLPFPDICDVWPHQDLGDSFRSPVRSNVPALFVSGTVDGRTPVANARAAMAGFPNGKELLIDPAGHDDDLLISSPDIGRIIAAFFRGQEPASGRLALPPLKFAR